MAPTIHIGRGMNIIGLSFLIFLAMVWCAAVWGGMGRNGIFYLSTLSITIIKLHPLYHHIFFHYTFLPGAGIYS
jgi:hypothetical protein